MDFELNNYRIIRIAIGYVLAVIIGGVIADSLALGLLLGIGILSVFCLPEVLSFAGSISFLLGSPDVALKLSNAGLMIDKTEPFCLTTKSASLVRLGKLSEAEKIIEPALETKMIEPWQNLWSAKYSMGKAQEALEIANKIIEKKPKHWVGYYARAATCCFLSINKNYEQMMSDIEMLEKRQPRSPYTYCAKALVNLELSRIDVAMEAATKSVKFGSHQLDFKLALIAAHIMKFEFTEAVELLNKFKNKKPMNELAVYFRALMFIQQNMYDAAMRDIMSLGEVEANKPAIKYIQGLAWINMNHIAFANNNARVLVEFLPESCMGYLLQAAIYLKIKRYDDALKEIENCIELNKYSSDTHSLKAAVYLEKGEYQKAIDSADEALRLNKYACSAARTKSLAYLALNMMTECDEWSDKADEIFFDNAYAWYSYGEIAAAKEDYEKALEKFTRAVEVNAFEPSLWEARAKIYDKLDNAKKASEDRAEAQKLRKEIEAEAAQVA